jgi:hypothetical protein
MMTSKSLGALLCWLIALPLQLWGLAGGPSLAPTVGLGFFAVGLVLFTAWANAGGMPPMYRH